ncbi:LPS export ABC transporter periplasmic protein LptC [Motiliproteus sp. SC1-56]|uniref:LPS export ABC transporter periplasmic protein LptC n=1 Tax=Motiliproteus sp. SC1-56 TaxID=2799565 RepID=UPI001A903DE6|nr:LPS export ABC transporter periplasmic protein LptC [Motiliproteus sp. SC1-56]
MSRYKLRLTLTLSLSVLILGYWGFSEHRHPVTDATTGALDGEIDAYIENTRMVDYDPSGLPARTLIAERIEHHERQDITRLSAPDITWVRANGTPLQISARRGQVRGSDEQIRLQQQVVITDRARADYRLETPSLTLNPNRDYGETDAPVHIFHGTGETRAIGMRLFMDEDRVELLQRVRGTHDPK